MTKTMGDVAASEQRSQEESIYPGLSGRHWGHFGDGDCDGAPESVDVRGAREALP